MKNTIELKSPERDPYTRDEKINTAVGVAMLIGFAFILLAQ